MLLGGADRLGRLLIKSPFRKEPAVSSGVSWQPPAAALTEATIHRLFPTGDNALEPGLAQGPSNRPSLLGWGFLPNPSSSPFLTCTVVWRSSHLFLFPHPFNLFIGFPWVLGWLFSTWSFRDLGCLDYFHLRDPLSLNASLPSLSVNRTGEEKEIMEEHTYLLKAVAQKWHT